MTRSRCQITFEGLNLNRTLTMLSNRYTLYNVERQGKKCRITVQSKVHRQVVAFLKEKCYNILDVRQQGLAYVKTFFKLHWLLPVYLVLAVAILFLSANFCWKIEVVGDFSTQEVIQALDDDGIGIGTKLFRLNVDKLENSLANKLDAMYAVVHRKGSTLYVNVVKKRQAELPIDMHSRRDIVSTCTGKVVGVLCEQGTVLCKVGDTVHAGDILIAGQRTFNDGTFENVYALGCVQVECSVSGFAQYTGTVTETVETGKTFTTNCVVLFGQVYGEQPPFDNYRTQYTSTYLSPLNLEVRKTVYYQTQQVTRTVGLDDCLATLKNQALQNALKDVPFKTDRTEYSVSANGVTATVFWVVQIK